MRGPFQKAFAPVKALLPGFVSSGVRALATALATPVQFSLKSGHFKSSFNAKSVSRTGQPLPWYTYPCIHFIQGRDFSDKTILEYGGGQSTLWWAARSKKVITLEEDAEWHEELAKWTSANVDLRLIHSSLQGENPDLAEIREILQSISEKIDVIILDGNGNRGALVPLSLEKLADGGALICDDSHGYGFYEMTKTLSMNRVDFFGFQPGAIMENCTSIFFRSGCFLFDTRVKIPDMAIELY